MFNVTAPNSIEIVLRAIPPGRKVSKTSVMPTFENLLSSCFLTPHRLRGSTHVFVGTQPGAPKVLPHAAPTTGNYGRWLGASSQS